MKTIVAFNLKTYRAEAGAEFHTLADGVRYLLHRNSPTLGLRVKENGVVLGVARTAECKVGLMVDDLKAIAQVSSSNPVSYVYLTGICSEYDRLFELHGVRAGKIIGLPVRMNLPEKT